MTLREALLQYVTIRRALGTKLAEPERTLGQFVSFLEREHSSRITTALALRWAMTPQGVQRATWARRLSMVRKFATWLNAFDPQTEVPPRRLIPGRRRRNRPHIFTAAEIGCLMAEAGRLRSATGLRPLPDLRRFPDLKGLADYVRSQGMQFGLWTDIEVARASSLVARRHPDWVMYLPGREEGLLNFGLRPVQQWAVATYDRLIGDYGIKWIFWDNNINPGPYWEANEAPERRGWMQHDYIRGVWAVREALLQKHPDVLLENCSSGGRRIDPGMFKRAHYHVLSDQFWYPDAIRYQFSGADWSLPADKIKSIVDTPLSPLADYVFHSNFGGLLSITEGVEDGTAEEKQRAKRHIEVYKSIRHLLGKDFHALFPQPQTMKEWDGWQFHDPQTGEGFILVFRAESSRENASPRLKALKASARYALKDPYSGKEGLLEGDVC